IFQELADLSGNADGRRFALADGDRRCHWLRRCRSVAEDRPLTRKTLFRLLWPEMIVTDDRGISKRPARNSMHASLARPSTGGAVNAIFSAPPSSPTTVFLLARG